MQTCLKTHIEHRNMCEFVNTDVYISELVVRSNATLEASTVLPLLNTTNFQVTDTTGVFHTVTIEQTTLVAGTTRLHSYWMQDSSFQTLLIFILN